MVNSPSSLTNNLAKEHNKGHFEKKEDLVLNAMVLTSPETTFNVIFPISSNFPVVSTLV